ncbi:hypothetical protein PHLGIDRAFT_129412 [Phlebiopsis gigantea 11061_1 CR5-6]|uniref:F-box domain-containing protein n=1 Tax=Phlebiopsis gigantea (strain 11061_1 CR5-6) TaxID=745531 RepID=A0A0C3S3T0_PHLG1|nr:hypothetical protein PHLGIDRAFT_129412 [Phlebiopsis gigantea 11061_1 CR5-6]
MAHIKDLPTELHLLIIPHLYLSELISARDTCHLWRELILVAPLPLHRRKLLCLYDTLSSIPAFQVSRRLARTHVRPGFGAPQRQGYVDALPQNASEEFKSWILEWPEDAVVGALWPALQPSYNMSEEIFTYRCDIANRIAATSFVPTTHTLMFSLFSGNGSGPASVIALPLFDEGNGWTHWVVLSGEQETVDTRGKKRRVDMRGVVFSKVRGADGEDGYAEFLESPSPLDCPSSLLPSTESPASDETSVDDVGNELFVSAGPETWGPWLRYLEQETRKMQSRMEDAGVWCGCASCRR